MIKRNIVWLGLLCAAANAVAEFKPEAIGKVETLPESYPEHWVMVHDFSFFHMLEGEIIVADPLAPNLGGCATKAVNNPANTISCV